MGLTSEIEVLVFYVVYFGEELVAAIKSKDQGAAQPDWRSSTKSKMSPIKKLTLTFDNEGFFSEGDTITGTVSFSLTKDTKVKSVSLKAKGEANVHWDVGEISLFGHWRYFEVKDYLVAKHSKDRVYSKLPNDMNSPTNYRFFLKGSNCLRFSFSLPHGNMPSSFNDKTGSIFYMLEVKIKRGWWRSSSVQKEINFVSRSILNIGQIMSPQSGTVKKRFLRGKVQMTASVNRKTCPPGEIVSVFAKICNSSSKKMRPKFRLKRKIEYCVYKTTKTKVKTLFKSVGDIIGPNTEVTASCNILIPPSAIYTINNCDMISVEYRLKVYLDISFAFDPKVVFPLIVAPSVASNPSEEEELYPSDAFGGLQLE